MPKYQCPECEAVLKRTAPIEEGKKIKCPKCETIFKAKAIYDTAEEAAAAKQKTKATERKAAIEAAAGEDDEVGGFLSLSRRMSRRRPIPAPTKSTSAISATSFPKASRGPAIGKVVQPSSFILFAGGMRGDLPLLPISAGLLFSAIHRPKAKR